MSNSSEITYRIKRAAKQEFREKGYNNTSVREIAKRAGYTTGVIYSRFKDKEEIFNSLIKFGIMAMDEYLSKSEVIELRDRLCGIYSIMHKYKEEFELITQRAKGTAYENYIETLAYKERNLIEHINKRLDSYNLTSEEFKNSLSINLAVAVLKSLME